MTGARSERAPLEPSDLRRLEREWQNEIGHTLLDKPFETEGSALVFQRQFERIERALAGLPEGPLVEVGCGLGQLLGHLRGTVHGRGRLLVGIDVSVAVERLPSLGAEPLRGDGEALPLRDESVAALIYSGALHHVVDYRRALREAFRVLRPGGRLVIFEPRSGLFNRVVHRVLDPLVFRATLEYESPVDQHTKHAFHEEAVVDELVRCGASVTRQTSDFLAYPVTGCYAGSPFGRSLPVMRGLLALEEAILATPGLCTLAGLISWRFLVVADKPGRPALDARAGSARDASELVACPSCHGSLSRERPGAFICSACRVSYRVERGVPVLLVDEATPLA